MEWISVKDGLPELDQRCLVVWAKFGVKYPDQFIGYIESETNKWDIITPEGLIEDACNNADMFYITHWMPLPELPAKKTKTDSVDAD